MESLKNLCMSVVRENVHEHEYSASSLEQIYILGGEVDGSESASVRTYSLEAGCQQTQINMNQGRRRHCAAYCHANKQMIVVGGYGADNKCSTVETCTVTGDAALFTTLTTKEPIYAAACMSIGSKAYIMGGDTSNCECYDMQHDSWTHMQPLPYNVGGEGCALCEDEDKTTILLMGGFDEDTGSVMDTVLQYDDENQWRERADLRLPDTLCFSSAVNWCGSVVIVGGEVEGVAKSECYSLDMVNKQWVSMPPLNTQRYGHQAVVLDGKIVVIGGRDGSFDPLNSVEVFDGEKWTDASPLDATIAFCAALVI